MKRNGCRRKKVELAGNDDVVMTPAKRLGCGSTQTGTMDDGSYEMANLHNLTTGIAEAYLWVNSNQVLWCYIIYIQ